MLPSGYVSIELVDSAGKARSSRHIPVDSSVIVGRDPNCELPLPIPRVSRKHAEIRATRDGHIVIRDLGSANGTFIGNVRLKKDEPRSISQGQSIVIGGTVWIVHIVLVDLLPSAPRSAQIASDEFFVAEKTLQLPSDAETSSLASTSASAIPPGERAGHTVSLSGPSVAAVDRGCLVMATSRTFRRSLLIGGGILFAAMIAVAIAIGPIVTRVISRRTAALIVAIYAVLFLIIVHTCARYLPRNPFR